MKRVKIGDEVLYVPYLGTRQKAIVVSIEICKIGEKDGRPVKCCDIDNHSNGTIILSNNHWCYFDQIIKVTKHG